MIKSRTEVDVEAVKKVLDKASDWSAKCRRCGKVLQGTKEELLAHKCDG